MRAMRLLEKAGVLEDGHVEAVYPGDETAQFKGAFVVTFHGSKPRQVADTLNELPGVSKASIAPSRAAL